MPDDVLNTAFDAINDDECQVKKYDSGCIRDRLAKAYPTKQWDVVWMGNSDAFGASEENIMFQTVFADYMQHWTRAQFRKEYESSRRPGQHLLIFADRKSKTCA